MKANYEVFFELHTTHNYYRSGVCECLAFKPDTETSQLFKRYQIAVAMVAGGFRLYTCGSNISALLSSLISGSSRSYFRFYITCTDANFCNFSSLPFNWAGSIKYNTNNTSISESGAITLTPGMGDSTPSAYAGEICINFNDLVSPEKNRCYHIVFVSRTTQWQYYIINRSKLELTSLLIEGNTQNTFEGPQFVTTVTGEPAMLFSSGKQLLPLSSWPKYKFNLVNRLPPVTQDGTAARTTAKVIFKGLPSPDPGYLNPIMIDNQQQLSSPMYVYI